MRLRDASAYNVQFDAGRPILIDSLSFEVAEPTEPWPAYRQFCEHFIAPLALMAHRDARCGLMLREFIDGIPLDLAARLLPGRTRLNLGLSAHVHLHAGAQRRAAKEAPPRGGGGAAGAGGSARPGSARCSTRCSARSRACATSRPATGWSTRRPPPTRRPRPPARARSCARCSRAVGGRTAWDVGANIGVYSAMAADAGYRVVAFDQDAASVEAHWRRVRGGANPADPAAHPGPRQPVAGHRLGARGALLVPRARGARRDAGPGAGPSPGDRQQRAAPVGRAPLRAHGTARDRRVRAEGRPDDAPSARRAARHLRALRRSTASGPRSARPSGSCARRRLRTRRARSSCSSASDATCALRTTARIDSPGPRSVASSP